MSGESGTQENSDEHLFRCVFCPESFKGLARHPVDHTAFRAFPDRVPARLLNLNHLFGAIIAWRTGAGALSLKEVGETSAILAWPVWVAQALMVPGFIVLAVAGFYMMLHLIRVARSELQA